MNLNPYEPNKCKSEATTFVERNGSRWHYLFLFIFGGVILIIYCFLNLGSYSGVGMPRRYASYSVEFETPLSIMQSATLNIVALGLSAITMAITLLLLRQVFKEN